MIHLHHMRNLRQLLLMTIQVPKWQAKGPVEIVTHRTATSHD
jgi:hypothetical protein